MGWRRAILFRLAWGGLLKEEMHHRWQEGTSHTKGKEDVKTIRREQTLCIQDHNGSLRGWEQGGNSARGQICCGTLEDRAESGCYFKSSAKLSTPDSRTTTTHILWTTQRKCKVHHHESEGTSDFLWVMTNFDQISQEPFQALGFVYYLTTPRLEDFWFFMIVLPLLLSCHNFIKKFL